MKPTTWLVSILVCLLTPTLLYAQDASYCSEPATYNFVSAQNGAWSSGSTWVGGVAPSANLSSGQRVLITHNVTRITSANGDFFPAPNSVVVIKNGGFLHTNQTQMENTSTIIINYGRLRVNQNLQQKTSTARICGINACIVVDENYQVESGAQAYFRSSSLDIGGNTSGNFQVPSGGNSVSGSDVRIWLKNGNLQNSGSWTATISRYRVSGSVDGIPAAYRPASQTSAAAMPAEMNTCSYNPLPVTIAYVNAVKKGNQLQVQWATATETNNSHFDIEASTNGSDFAKIGRVNSKAADGNSTVLLEYTFSKSVTAGTVATGIFLFLVSAITMRRRKIAGTLLLLLSMGFIWSACTKNETLISQHQVLFIRLAEVDIDGTTIYSKVVQVTE